MAKVIWTESAQRDLDEIVTYIGQDSPAYAYQFGMRLIECTDILANNPRIGRVTPHRNDPAVREIIYRSYRIIYQVIEDACYITTVVHSSRNYNF